MAKVAKQMTRVVMIGKLSEYKYQTEPFTIGKGVLEINGTKPRFTLFNKDKEGTLNPHTKASDFEKEFKEGDLVYVTGQDNRSYSEAKDTYYEDTQVWDYRAAEEDEIERWVFVYIGDVKSIDKEEIILSITNYKDVEMLYPLQIGKAKVPAGTEIGDRIKVKGTISNERVEDFYGDGEFKHIRRLVEISIVNNRAELEADLGEGPQTGGGTSEKGLW